MAADPKPAKRHKADVNEWKILRKLKLGPCRVCDGGLGVRRIELHHLVGRDLGGDDVPDNLVALCSFCHRRVEERSRVACSLLRESLTAREIDYVCETKTYFFLDRYYPRRSAEDVQATRGTEGSFVA